MIYQTQNINDTKFTQELFDIAFSAMTPERKAKADHYKHLSDRRLCVFSDMLLRELLKTHFGINNPSFYTNEKGKPCLVGDKLHFSLSHSGSFIACALDTSPIGIDIEVPRDIDKRVMNHSCTQEEIDFIYQNQNSDSIKLPANSPEALRFLSLWTAKEAYLKLTGDGLGGGLKNIAIVENNELRTHINHKKLMSVKNSDYIMSLVFEDR